MQNNIPATENTVSEHDVNFISSLEHITTTLIEEYLDAGEDRSFIYNGRKIRGVNRVRQIIFPFLIRMVEHQLSAYTGKRQDNFIFEVSAHPQVGNMLSVVALNPKNPPMFMLVSSAMLFVFKTYFTDKAHRVDLYDYIASINP
jgi:hypothetical protein